MKKSGFTLAEVLLTLAIIGVVAAMTVPSLMNSTEDKKLGAAAKKAYNTLQNAITMRQAMTEMTPEDATGLFQDLVGKANDKVQTLKYNEVSSDYSTVQTPDGIVMYVTENKACLKPKADGTFQGCTVVVDVNGDGGPNFSGVTGGTSPSGATITALKSISNVGTGATVETRGKRDLVYFTVEGMDVKPGTDYYTSRYITGKASSGS